MSIYFPTHCHTLQKRHSTNYRVHQFRAKKGFINSPYAIGVASSHTHPVMCPVDMNIKELKNDFSSLVSFSHESSEMRRSGLMRALEDVEAKLISLMCRWLGPLRRAPTNRVVLLHE